MEKTNNIAIEDMPVLRAGKDASAEIFEQLSALDILCVGNEGWSADSFRAEAEKDNGIVLYIPFGEGIAALICGYFAADQADIASVAVDPAYRRRGLADRLMESFEAQLPDITESIFLDVRESNEPAAALYRKHGFEQIAVRKNYYEKPDENAVIMQKFLDKEGQKC